MANQKTHHLSLLSSLTTLSLLLAGCSLPSAKPTTKVPNQPVPITESSPNTDTTTPADHQLVGSDADEHGCIGSAGYTWCEAKQKCLRIWEETCDSATNPEDVAAAVKTALIVKHGWDPNTIAVAITQTVDNQYIKGTVSPVGEQGGGGLVFAAKINGAWQIVADGNGITECSSLDDYPDFPASLLPSCYNSSTSQITNR